MTRNITSKPSQVRIENNKIPINFDIKSLELFCMYVVSENLYIRASHLSNMKKVFDIMDISKYNNDPQRLKMIEFIQRGLEAKVILKMKNRDVVEKYINGGMEDKSLIDTTFIKELSTSEIEWINQTISETLKHLFIYSYVDRMQSACARFKAEDYRRRGDIVDEFENIVDELKKEFRRAKNESYSDAEFSLEDGLFEEIISDIYAREINPSRRLVCGMQGVNELVGGGFEGSRVYMLFGMAGCGKSLTMLNIAKQIKKYNTNYKCKDRTKRPCIVLLTMENSIQETVTRLFSLITNDSMRNYTLDEVIDRFRNEGELTLTDESPIDIFIKYKPNMSVDTSYMYTLVDDLDEKGYEVICFMQDHIKRIRPAFSRGDLRLDLGEVVNDFKVFANEKDIPVISDSHLNRDGARVVDMALSANKQDVTRLIGRANVGESMLMIDNTDCGIILNKEYDKAGKEYMIFSRIKMRDKAGKRDYIAQPFVEGSTIALYEDFNDPIPSFKESLHTPANSIVVHGNDYANKMVKQCEDDEEDSIFSTPVPGPAETNTQNQYNVVYGGMPPIGSNVEVIGSPSEPIYPTTQSEDQQAILNQIKMNQILASVNLPSPVTFYDENGNEIDLMPQVAAF